MAVQVLQFESEDYVIKVAAKDISANWRKFSARINSPERYASYSSSSDGVLKIFNCATRENEVVPQEEWDSTRPVFFDTQFYQFSISFKNLKNDTTPYIVHQLKDVESVFFAESEERKITGTIDFLNHAGRFSLCFVFEKNNGVKCQEKFEFDVVSPKLDLKKDVAQIIQQLKKEYGNLVFRYLTLTFQQFQAGRNVSNEIIWLSVFKQIIENYLVAVRLILNSPHKVIVRKNEYVKAEKIKKWTPKVEELFANCYFENPDLALHKYYLINRVEYSKDSKENRFVKFSLRNITERLRKVSKTLSNMDASQHELYYLNEKLSQLEKLKGNHFWKSVGDFEGFNQESLVMQQRNGYAQVYRYWLLLQNGLDLINGSVSIGTLSVWKLYELWCFLKVKDTVCKVLNINPMDENDSPYIEESLSNTFKLFNEGLLEGYVKIKSKLSNDYVVIRYQYSYERPKTNSVVFSMTVPQKPDIVMNIHKDNGIVLTYLFDAKYKVKGDERDFVQSIGDCPDEDSLNQMHRYRDAIYYANREHGGLRKEIIGGYILFPGRLDESAVLNGSTAKPYYIKSIEDVNIGAFPLLPKDESGILLYNHLKNVLLDKGVETQLMESIPQKGLIYEFER